MYTCKVCLRTFSRKDSLSRHLRTIHEKDVQNVMCRFKAVPTIFTGKQNATATENFNGYGFLSRKTSPGLINVNATAELNHHGPENVIQWKHPFTCIIAGPTSSGKSTFTARFLKYLDEVIYCAPESSYPDLSECPAPIQYLDWLPNAAMFTDKKARLVIVDDMMRESNEKVVDLFTKHSHQMGLSVIFITQNIFHKGKGMRDISLNAHYIVVYKSPRYRGQFATLARQISPGHTQFTNEVFEDATSVPYGYLVVDLTQTTPDHLRFRTKIFPDDEIPNIFYVPKTHH